MVSKNGKGVFSPSQVGPPMCEHFHHGKQFSFIDVVVSLCGGECGGVVCDGMELGLSFTVRRGIPFAPFLGEYCSNSVCQSIGLQIETSFKIGLDEDWFSTHEGFECFKCLELGFAPMPQ